MPFVKAVQRPEHKAARSTPSGLCREFIGSRAKIRACCTSLDRHGYLFGNCVLSIEGYRIVVSYVLAPALEQIGGLFGSSVLRLTRERDPSDRYDKEQRTYRHPCRRPSSDARHWCCDRQWAIAPTPGKWRIAHSKASPRRSIERGVYPVIGRHCGLWPFVPICLVIVEYAFPV